MSENTFRGQLNLNVKPVICKKCGGTLEHKGRGEYVCTSCGAVEYDDFGKINKFLEVNGPSPAMVISEGTGVPVSKINRYLREGRIEIPDGSGIYIRCENCGAEIRYGRYCAACAAKLSKDLKGALAEAGEAPTHSSGGAMRFLGKDRR